MKIRTAALLMLAAAVSSCDDLGSSWPPGSYRRPGKVGTMLLSSTLQNFTASEGGPSPLAQSVSLSNVGAPGSVLHWSAASDQPWLVVSPASGSRGTAGATTLDLSVDSALQTEAWTGPTSTVDAPVTGSAPDAGQAVWTGSSMVTWNGDPAIGGKFYDPTSNSWSGSVTAVGAPAKRTYFSAVWTGTEMIIWGGITFWGGTPLNDGGRYNPSTDSWTPMSTVGAPSARWSHRAVWTGTQMIVWGGDSGGYSFKNTGGVYDPATNTWIRATSTVNAPSLRANHAAVWTGVRMLVWGGEDPGKLNTGAFYDPGADAWDAATTTSGAPAGRSHLQGVWTGRELIVWGGFDGSSLLDTGARYNPATDSWTGTTPLAGAPEARSNQSMVWTGSRMIVWGGTSPSMLLNTGGIYRPPYLAQGLHTGTITLMAPGATNSPQTITVLLTITP